MKKSISVKIKFFLYCGNYLYIYLWDKNEYLITCIYNNNSQVEDNHTPTSRLRPSIVYKRERKRDSLIYIEIRTRHDHQVWRRHKTKKEVLYSVRRCTKVEGNHTVPSVSKLQRKRCKLPTIMSLGIVLRLLPNALRLAPLFPILQSCNRTKPVKWVRRIKSS